MILEEPKLTGPLEHQSTLLQYYAQQLVAHAAMLVALVAAIFAFLQIQTNRPCPSGSFLFLTAFVVVVLSMGTVHVLFRLIFYSALVNSAIEPSALFAAQR